MNTIAVMEFTNRRLLVNRWTKEVDLIPRHLLLAERAGILAPPFPEPPFYRRCQVSGGSDEIKRFAAKAAAALTYDQAVLRSWRAMPVDSFPASGSTR